MIARLDPERKRLLLAGTVGYALCIWQAFCLNQPWPDLSPPPRPHLLDIAGPAVSPAAARRMTLDMLQCTPLSPGEVRASINMSTLRQSVDPEAVSPDGPDAWARLAEVNLWGKSRAVFRPTPTYTMACVVNEGGFGPRPANIAPPGHLAARFESGPDGAASVGHTPSAGTSYGTFQIAAGTPTYANFIRFLKRSAPDLASRLSAHGPADTGSTRGAVPEEWRRIATEQPRRFERLQYEFILNSHYRPAVAGIHRQTGVDVSALSPASREVLWSTAVQHGVGGATEIYGAAIGAILPRVVEERRMSLFEKALIEEVYRLRLQSWGHGPLVGRGVMASRYGREKAQALTILDRHYSGT